jgi:hypothetical protein
MQLKGILLLTISKFATRQKQCKHVTVMFILADAIASKNGEE